MCFVMNSYQLPYEKGTLDYQTNEKLDVHSSAITCNTFDMSFEKNDNLSGMAVEGEKQC